MACAGITAATAAITAMISFLIMCVIDMVYSLIRHAIDSITPFMSAASFSALSIE